MAYTRQINSVHQTMIKKGQAVTLTRRVSGAYDPATGTTVVTETTQSGYGVPGSYKQNEIDGALVQQGDVKLLLSTKQSDGTAITKPQVNDEVTLSGRTFTIQSVSEVWPGGDAILYTCQLR